MDIARKKKCSSAARTKSTLAQAKLKSWSPISNAHSKFQATKKHHGSTPAKLSTRSPRASKLATNVRGSTTVPVATTFLLQLEATWRSPSLVVPSPPQKKKPVAPSSLVAEKKTKEKREEAASSVNVCRVLHSKPITRSATSKTSRILYGLATTPSSPQLFVRQPSRLAKEADRWHTEQDCS